MEKENVNVTKHSMLKQTVEEHTTWTSEVTKRDSESKEERENPDNPPVVNTDKSEQKESPKTEQKPASNYNAQVFMRGKMPVEVSENPQLTEKDIYMNWWRCRDFELSHLWQRSVFLSAILLLCFTGYGMLIARMFDSAKNHDGFSLLLIMNNIAVVFCFFGFVLSTFWIMMAKGSKAWHETIENTISVYENQLNLTNRSFNLTKLKKEDMDKSFLSLDMGAYSPSKINIGIGIVSMLIWVIALVIHGILCFVEFKVAENCLNVVSFAIPIVLFVCVLLIGCTQYCSLFESKALSEK